MFDRLMKKNKLLLIIGLICFFLIVLIVGYTYAFFAASATSNGVITGAAAIPNLGLDVEILAPNNLSKGLIPQRDQYITSAVKGKNGSCIDDNDNIVCQVYKVSVKNNGTTIINVDGTLMLNVNSNYNLKWSLIDNYTDNMSNNPNLITTINNQTTKTIVANEKLEVNEEKTYYIVIWISETESIQNDNGNFTGVVTFKSSEYLTESSKTLYSLGIAPNPDNPTFEKTSCSNGCQENTVGVYSLEDDLGTSYYFRGDVENNYVYFAGYYWRIIRINGDGSIRMIYDGTQAHKNGVSSSNRIVTKKSFKSSPYNDNTYVGYMYGVEDVTEEDENAYYLTHSNTSDSTMKDYLEDTWYPTISNEDKIHIVDAIYCNDRSLDSSLANNPGIGKSNACYGAYERVYRYLDSVTPILKCPLKNDRFTYGSTNINGVETNGKLNAPVGLITADEVSLAGAKRGESNQKFYLYTGTTYWTLSPAYFLSGMAVNFCSSDYGYANGYAVYASQFGVKPVISLNPDSITGGKGTIDSPFVVGDNNI